MYDITKEASFLNIEIWMDNVKELAENKIKFVLVGTKIDICEKDQSTRAVTTERAEEFAQKHKMSFYETSAFTDAKIQ